MPPPANNFRFGIIPVILVLVALSFTGSPSAGMGLIPVGGTTAVGLSLNEISTDVTRPLSPLNEFIIDEVFQPLLPLMYRSPAIRLEENPSGSPRIVMASNLVWGDNPESPVTPENIISCLENRAMERWDAAWALRCIQDSAGLSDGIDGLAAGGEHNIEITLASGFNFDDLARSLNSPALRLSWPSQDGPPAGTGPFSLDPIDRESSELKLKAILVHAAGRPYLGEVDTIGYPSADDSVLDFGRGYLDALLLASNERNRYNESSRAVPSKTETVGNALLVLLFNPLMLPDTAERQALALALDRSGIAEVVLGESSLVVSDFLGTPAAIEDWSSNLEQARILYADIDNPRENLTMLVADDPAARATAGRIRANWGSFGVPVDIINDSGPLSLSIDADVILLAVRIPDDGVLPQCLSLIDRNGWWEFIRLAMPQEAHSLLRDVRSLAPSADLQALGSALESSGLMIPLAMYDILMAPGPGLSLVPDSVYPGTPFWRAFVGELPEPVSAQVIEPEETEENAD